MRLITGAITKKVRNSARPEQHLVGRRLAGAERLAQDAEHDHDAGEGGHHQQDRRQQGQRRHQRQHLQRQGVGLAAAGGRLHAEGGDARSCGCRRGGKSRQQQERERQQCGAAAFTFPDSA